MQVCYIASVVATADQGMVEKAISKAIQTSIVVPFQTWAHNTWINLIDTSFIFCLAVAFMGAIFGILGIKKGYKVTVFSIIFYFLLRFFSWAMGWY